MSESEEKSKEELSDLKIDLDKYEIETLELIYNEAVEQLSQTFISFRANKNISLIAIGVYFSILSVSTTELIDLEYSKSDVFYLMLALSMIISSAFLFRNLLPAKMTMPGCRPEQLIHPYYEKYKGEVQRKRFYEQRLIDLNSGIKKNKKEVALGSKRLKISITSAVALVALVVFVYLIVA